MAAKMVQEMGQDGVSHTYTPCKRPSLIQRIFVRMSTEVDVAIFIIKAERRTS